MFEWFVNYYHGWIAGGYFYWAYSIDGIGGPIEPWHTPLCFWISHIVLIGCVVYGIILLVRWLISKLEAKNCREVE